MIPALIATGIVVLLLISAMVTISTYNQLVALKNLCDNGFAQIDVQLRRRYDLIPNLVECVKGYMSHERQTLENVISARNQAQAGLAQVAKDPGNAASLQQWMGAESSLGNALGRLNFVMEAYPELKANENVAMLTEELTSTENKVAFARQAYNDWVMGFNTYRESFPTVMLAPMLGYPDSRLMVEIEDQVAIQQAPVVSLAS
jgi:LemA protein